MGDPNAREPSRLRTTAPRLAAVTAALALLGSLGVGAAYRAERAALDARSRRTEVAPGVGTARLKFYCDGIRTPPACPAEMAPLAGDEEVLGLEAGGMARAYRLAALNDRTRQIVNDLVGGSAVSVTYCYANGCARAFGGGPAAAPLEVSQAGLYGGRMVVKTGGVEYLQDTGEALDDDPHVALFPYRAHPLTRTTWRRWKALHPDTDVYAGD